MGNTPTYGLPYPEATDFVTDGAQAIQDLAEAVDADLGAAAAAAVARAGVQSAVVATSETTTSTTYTDLATVGPAVTVTIGASGLALVFATAWAAPGATTDAVFLSTAVSGASTVAATDGFCAIARTPSAGGSVSAVLVGAQSGLTPGSNTFTLKYRTSAGTPSFTYRRLIVIPL